MTTINQELLDQIIKFQIDIRRFEAGLKKEVQVKLEKMQRDLIVELSGGELTEFSKKKTQALLSNLSPVLANHYAGIEETVQDSLDGLSKVQVRQAEKSLKTTVFIENAVNLPTQHVIERVSRNVLINGGPLNDWWQKQRADTLFKVSAQIREGILFNETNQSIISRIIGKNGAPGVMNLARNNAASLVQTVTHAVANEARQAVYEENDDIIKSFVWTTALDSHVCRLCIARSGKRWKNDKSHTPIGHSIPFQVPGIHYNDRCVLLPETLTFKELGVDLPEPPISTRASSLGPISAKSSFSDYLKRVPVSQQNEMLGVGRAQLWRDGKITLSQLLDGKGRELSLVQLQSKYGVTKITKIAPPAIIKKAVVPSKFVEAKTTRAAEEWAIASNLADNADYKGVDVRVANEWNKGLHFHLKEFPELRKNQKFTGTIQGQNKLWHELEAKKVAEYQRSHGLKKDLSDTDLLSWAKRMVRKRKAGGEMAHSWRHKDVSGIAVNKKFGVDHDKFVEIKTKNVVSKYHAQGTESVKSVVDHEMGHELDALLGLRGDADVVNLYKSFNREEVTENLSKYGSTNIAEFIAEAWSESLNNAKPRDISRRMDEIIRRRYREKFGG